MVSRNSYRLILTFAIFLIGIGLYSFNPGLFGGNSSSRNQLVLGSRLPACLEKSQTCETFATLPVSSSKKDSKSQNPSQRLSAAECQSKNDLVGSAYKEAAINALNKINAQFDSVRQSASQTGESYLAFDNQLNHLSAAYNASAEQLYQAALKNLDGCKAAFAPPTLFKPFTP